MCTGHIVLVGPGSLVFMDSGPLVLVGAGPLVLEGTGPLVLVTKGRSQWAFSRLITLKVTFQMDKSLFAVEFECVKELLST